MKTSTAAVVLLSLAVVLPLQAQNDEPAKQSVQMQFVGASLGAAAPSEPLAAESRFFSESSGAAKKGSYHDIYPGIDMACYGDDYSMEYVFVVSRGGDPSLITWRFPGARWASPPGSESLLLRAGDIEISVSQPVAFLVRDKTEKPFPAFFAPGIENEFTLNCASATGELQENLNRTVFNVVPAGGQPLGPNYDFFIGKYEVTCDQFLEFLNDAQANPMNKRGSSMYFDDNGNVWFSPQMKPGRDELFNIKKSKFVYHRKKTSGQRYDHRRNAGGEAVCRNHPVSGVSWYGAVKYCNWLTLKSGRGMSELCYREGTNALDWAPVTATNWSNGVFTNAERILWLKVKGFRLPMVGTNGTELAANDFNEAYKAGAWTAMTNLPFGYGRDLFDWRDANFLDRTNKAPGALPVGYFAGTNFVFHSDIRPSQNYYGIYDISGNAAEWTTDPNLVDRAHAIALFGGSWAEKHMVLEKCRIAPPCSIPDSSGFRVLTTFMPAYSTRIHALVSLFTEKEVVAGVILPAGVPPPEEQVQPPEAAVGPAEEVVLPPGVEKKEGVVVDVTGNQIPSGLTAPMGVLYTEKPGPILPPPPFVPWGGGAELPEAPTAAVISIPGPVEILPPITNVPPSPSGL